MRPSSFSLRKRSESVYQIHSTRSEIHASAPYSSRHSTRFSFENVFKRQKISPTIPISGCRCGTPPRRQLAETVAASNHGIAQRLELHPRLDRSLLECAAQVGQRFRVDRFRVAAPLLIRAVHEQQLLQQIGAQQRAPARAHERFGERAEAAIGVLTAGREDLHGLVSVGVQNVAQVGRVLAETAGALGGGHEQRHARGVGRGPLQHLHEIAHRHLGGITFVARSVARAQLARAAVGGRSRLGLQADGAKGRGERLRAAVSHGRNVNALAA